MAVLLALLFAAQAGAAVPVLKRGDHGQRVADLQWLLGGHRPSAYRGISTFRGKPNGLFGANTARGVVRMKLRLGWPVKEARPIAGRDFIEILTGKRKRPIMYVARAARRVREGIPGEQPPCVRRVLSIARSQVGVSEVWGSNWGPQVREYQSATGAYRAPWCVSFAQWVFRRAGYGTFANRSAAVFYVREYARGRGWLRARPKAGALVLFLDRLGHMGIVERVTASGFISIEGNASNRVLRRTHYTARRPLVFAYLPRCI